MATRRSRRRQARIEELTPFARELQEWLSVQRNQRGYMGLSHAELADRLPAARATVDAWFRPMDGKPAPTLPSPETFYALLRITGWPMEKLLSLTGYAAPPPHVVTIWEFLHDDLEQEATIDPLHKRIVRAWLERAQVKYQQLPKRPERGDKQRAAAAPVAPVEEQAVEEREATVTPLHRRDREPVGSGGK